MKVTVFSWWWSILESDNPIKYFAEDGILNR